jgi:polar amino acid transport system ATP-binding protein
MSPRVRFQNVRKSYGDIEVLKGISLEVPKGNVVALIGQSGSGKSTALRCINGLEEIDGGELYVCDRALHKKDCDISALRLQVGIVFQSYNLFPHLTVEKNITLAPRKVKNIGRKEAQELAAHVLGQVGLSDKVDAYPDQLSGGQQQRVAIARSLAMQPELMLFDEVTSALDPQITGEVLKVIEGLAKDGMTMVLVTHEMGFASAIADQIIYMRDGVVWEAGDRNLLKSPATQELRQFISNGL